MKRPISALLIALGLYLQSAFATTPAFRSAGTATNHESSTTPGAPSGATDGDVLILYVFGKTDDDGTGNPLTLSANGTGWTSLGAQHYTDSGTDARRVAGWWYRVSGSVPTMPTVSVSGDTDDGIVAVVAAYSGAITSGTPTEGYSTESGESSTMNGRSVTTTGPDRLVVNFFGQNDDRTSNPASGWAENSEQAAGAVNLIALDSIVCASAGTQSAPSRSIGAAEEWGTIGFALIPEEEGGGDPPATTLHMLPLLGVGK
jgi:hypothetical protein